MRQRKCLFSGTLSNIAAIFQIVISINNIITESAYLPREAQQKHTFARICVTRAC